jgi:hypothetical protein
MNEYEQVLKQVEDLQSLNAEKLDGWDGTRNDYGYGWQSALAAIKDFCQKKINASIRNK